MQQVFQSGVTESATLAINEQVGRIRAAGGEVVHLGFGEAGLPPLPELVTALSGAAKRTFYPPTAGSLTTREAVANFFTTQRGLATTAEQIVTAPGSKALIYAVLAAVPGAVVLPRPSWVSYGAQAHLLQREVIWADINEYDGGYPDPENLRAALEQAKKDGITPGVMVTTLPDNPTGTLARPQTVKAVCEIAEEFDLLVISDEIYRDLIHDPDAEVLSPVDLIPDRVVVTGGLSKNLALGGWRTGFMRLPDTAYGKSLLAAVLAIGSEIWSAMPAPVEAAMEVALSDLPEVATRVKQSRKLHSAVAQAVYEILVGAKVSCRAPSGGFYLYPDFEPHRQKLADKRIATSMELASFLLNECAMATLPGSAFGDHPTALRLRLATSLLYGQSEEERLAALVSTNPVETPQIAENLRRIEQAIGELLS